MWYGLYETILNAKNLVITKIFYPKARLVRFPSYIRNKQNISFGEGFTCGYRCRLESVQTSSEKCGEIIFGKNVKIGDSVHIAAASKVEIGDDVLMASHIFITDLDHGSYAGENQTNPAVAPDERELYCDDVKIGNNVWIGENVVVLKGVTIGDGCIIGANSMVNKSVPDGCIVAGNPARVIKKWNADSQSWERESK